MEGNKIFLGEDDTILHSAYSCFLFIRSNNLHAHFQFSLRRDSRFRMTIVKMQNALNWYTCNIKFVSWSACQQPFFCWSSYYETPRFKYPLSNSKLSVHKTKSNKNLNMWHKSGHKMVLNPFTLSKW